MDELIESPRHDKAKQGWHMGGNRRNCIKMYLGAVAFVVLYTAGSCILAAYLPVATSGA